MHKRTRLAVILVLGCMGLLGIMSAARAEEKSGLELALIADGKSAYVIVLPDGDAKAFGVEDAAKLLQSCVEKSTGVKLDIVAEAAKPAGKPGIFLGATKAAGALPQSQTDWTYANVVRDNDLYLVGHDENPHAKCGERGAHLEFRGTYKAVTAFLDDVLGVKFLLPGTNGLYIPKRASIAIPAALNVVKMPPFIYVSGRDMGEPYHTALNHFLLHTRYRSYGGHSHDVAVPKAKYGKTHPEYFAEFGGVRCPDVEHLCISNPDVFRLMIEEIEQGLAKGYDWVQIGQTDGFRPCECAACRAIHSDPAERIWILHRRLAEEIKKKHPGKKLVLLSYGPTNNPPISFDRFPDNVMIEICDYTPESFQRWSKFTKNNVDFVVYIYNWGPYNALGFAPKRTPRFVAEQARFFRDNHVKGIYVCGDFENLGLEGPTFYVYGKMNGDPDADYHKFEEEFYTAAYGKARAPMKRFFSSLYERLELNSATIGRGACPLQGDPEDKVSYFFPPKLLLKMETDLAHAMQIAETEDEGVKARLRLVEREFKYLKNLSSIFFMYHTYRLQPDADSFNRLGALVEARNAMIDSWFDDKGKTIVPDGWPSFFNNYPKEFVKQGGRGGALLYAPFNWNISLLREKKILPGGKKSMTAVRATSPIKLDGVADEEEWRKAAEGEFVEVGMGDLVNATKFRVVYDNEAVYFQFTCALSDGRPIMTNPVGKDGVAYGQECLEIFLDPFGQRTKYYHFIFNPVPDSWYDDRFGFIEDPADPRYGKADQSWNGKWEYAGKIAPDGKSWTAEARIPFATLGIEPPKPGTTWTMNLAREHYLCEERNGVIQRISVYGKSDAEYSIWSPSMTGGGFEDLDIFGTLKFE